MANVSTYIASAIDRSPKTNAEIADEVKLQSANMISMIKQGRTKLPITRVVDFAKALDLDTEELFRMAMEEYMPDLLKVCDEIYGRTLNTSEERMLKRLRMHTGGKTFKLGTAVNEAIDTLGNAITGSK